MSGSELVLLEHEGWQRCGLCGADVREGYMAEHVDERCIVANTDGGGLP